MRAAGSSMSALPSSAAQSFARALGGDRGDVRERLTLRLARVVEERAAGADGEREFLAAVAGERRGAELLQELALCALHIELPGGKPGGEITVEVDTVGDEH